MSLLRTIRPLEQATIRSRVGRTSQPFTTAAFLCSFARVPPRDRIDNAAR